MNLVEDLAEIAEERPSGGCSICWAFRDAPADERLAMNQALAGDFSAPRIAAACRRNGYAVGTNSIRRHVAKGHQL